MRPWELYKEDKKKEKLGKLHRAFKKLKRNKKEDVLGEANSQDKTFNGLPDAAKLTPESVSDILNLKPIYPWEKFKEGFFAGLETIDKYTGGPVRKAVTEFVTGKHLAGPPTGAEQAKEFGASDVPYKKTLGVPEWLGGNLSPADIYGIGLEIIQDPLVLAGLAKQGVAKAAGLMRRAKQAEELAKIKEIESIRKGVKPSEIDITIEESGKLFEKTPPKTLEELENVTLKNAELPAKNRLFEIQDAVPDLETPPLKFHQDMLENPKAMKELKLEFENLPTDSAKKIAAYNQQMFNEATSKLEDTVKAIGKTEEIEDISKAGEDAIEAITNKYRVEKEELAPIFKRISETAGPLSELDSYNSIKRIAQETGLGKIFELDEETGRLFLKPNRPRYGLSDKEYKAISRVINDLQDGMTFEELQKTRDYLRKLEDPVNPKETLELSKIRKILLDDMYKLTKSEGEAREAFKRYAINEQKREAIEKRLGGKIENINKLYAINPDKAVKKVFSDPFTAETIKEYIGEESFNKMLASYIGEGLRRSTDSVRGFLPHKFKTWLRSNSIVLKRNLPKKAIERMEALADYGYLAKRFLDEVNPSGTAASLFNMFNPKNFSQKVSVKGFLHTVSDEAFSRAFKNRNEKKALEKLLDYTLEKTETPVSKKISKGIDTAVKAKAAGDTLQSVKYEKERRLKGPKRWTQKAFNHLLEDYPNSKVSRMLIKHEDEFYKDGLLQGYLLEYDLWRKRKNDRRRKEMLRRLIKRAKKVKKWEF